MGRLYSLLVHDVTRSDVPITPWIDFTCVLQDLSRKAFPKRKADATFVPLQGTEVTVVTERSPHVLTVSVTLLPLNEHTAEVSDYDDRYVSAAKKQVYLEDNMSYFAGI